MNGIHVGRLDNREKVRGIIHPKNGIASDLITFDIQNQPNMNNSCIEGRHKCDHLCLVSNRHYRNRPICHCGAGFKLSVDGMTCTTAYSAWDNFLLVNDAYQKQIFQVDLKSAEVGAINIFPANEPVALTYDPVELKVFWSDNKQNVIKQVTIDGKSEKTLMFFDNSSMCDGLAADYINKLLFFSDTGNNVIGVASMINYDYYTHVVTEDLDEPRDIVISPNQGVIYWSDWGTMPAIERANMDGTKREVVVKLTQPSWPNALALDIAENKLYWVDAQPDTISVIDLATKVITLLVQQPVAHFFSLDVSGDYLFVTDWKKNYLRRMNKNGGALEQFGDATFTRLYGIKVFNSSEAFKGVSVCAAGHCEHLCLPRQNNQYVCRCSVGYTGTASCQKDSIDEDGSIDPTPATDTSHEPPTTTVGAGPEVTSPNAEQWTEGVVSVIYTDPFGGAMMSNETDVSVQTVEVETTLAYKETTEITTLSTSVGSADNAVYAKSTKKDPILSPLVMGVIIGTVVVIVVIVVIIVASLTWRHYKYTPRHGRLIEDKNPTDFYTIAFSAPGDDALKPDESVGIENPIYDCLNDPQIIISTTNSDSF